MKVICDHLFISPILLTAGKQGLFHCPHILLFFSIYSFFLECLIVGLMKYTCFSAQIHSLRDMNKRIPHVSYWLDCSFLFRTEYYFVVLMYQSCFIHSLWLFSSFVIMTKMAINIPLQVLFSFLWIQVFKLFGQIQRSMSPDLLGRRIFSLVTNCLIVFQKACTVFHRLRNESKFLIFHPLSTWSFFGILTILVHVLWYLIAILKPSCLSGIFIFNFPSFSLILCPLSESPGSCSFLCKTHCDETGRQVGFRPEDF